jgi:hypothetical protein
MSQISTAREVLAADAELRRRQLALTAEFETTRPTPSEAENDAAAEGHIISPKEWDLSPVDPASFDPTEPPGRPGPPTNEDRPYASATSLSVAAGGVAHCTQGIWTNNPTSKTYQWRRGGTAISGATAPDYTLAAADVGASLACAVVAVNADGPSAPTVSNAIGPVIA